MHYEESLDLSQTLALFEVSMPALYNAMTRDSTHMTVLDPHHEPRGFVSQDPANQVQTIYRHAQDGAINPRETAESLARPASAIIRALRPPSRREKKKVPWARK